MNAAALIRGPATAGAVEIRRARGGEGGSRRDAEAGSGRGGCVFLGVLAPVAVFLCPQRCGGTQTARQLQLRRAAGHGHSAAAMRAAD